MIDVEINDAELDLLFAELAARLTDMSQPMQDIAQGLRDSTEDRFFQGVSPEGNPWAPKSAATIAAMSTRGRTADLRPLFGGSPSGLALHTSVFSNSGPDFAEVGTNKIQAAVMHFGAAKGAFGQTEGGTSLPFGDIPARPFLGVSDLDRTNITEIMREWLEDLENG